MEVGGDIHGIHSFEGGVENMEFGGDVGVIDESRSDAMDTQRRLALVVVVATLRTLPVVNESIQAPLDIDDLMFNDTCGTLSALVGEISQTSFIDKWEGQMSGTRSGSQPRSLSFGQFLTACNVMEPREDGFYYDTHGVRHMIIPSMGDLNHPVIYQECATTAEDPGHTVQQLEAILLASTVEAFDTPTSSLADINSRMLLESMESILEIQDTLPS
jgi:hypothetical protein